MISFENKVSFVLVFRKIERIEKYHNDLYYYVKREFFVNNTSLNK